jgi:hypothetical protein
MASADPRTGTSGSIHMDQRIEDATFHKEKNYPNPKMALKNRGTYLVLKGPSAPNRTRERSQRADATPSCFHHNYLFLFFFSAGRKVMRSGRGGRRSKGGRNGGRDGLLSLHSLSGVRTTAPLLQGGMTQLPRPALIPQIDHS